MNDCIHHFDQDNMNTMIKSLTYAGKTCLVFVLMLNNYIVARQISHSLKDTFISIQL